MDMVIDRPAIQYLGRDIVVVYQRQPESDCVYVTFDHMRPERTNPKRLDDWLLAKLGYSQLHVFASSNIWFQSSDMEDAIEVLRTAMAEYGRRVAWGSSMGGFAALQFADRLAVDAVLACGPQISIDPRKVPWDFRYRGEAENIPAFLYDDIAHRSLPSDTYVAFDPGQWHDRLNARAITAAHPNVRSLVVPFSGHEPTMFMLKQGMMEPVLTGLASGSLDLPSLAFARRSSRRAHPRYLEAVEEYRRTRVASPGRFAARAAEQRAAATPRAPSSSARERVPMLRKAFDRAVRRSKGEAEPEFGASVAAFRKERETLLEAARAERQELLRILFLERERAIEAVRDAHRERDATAAAATAERDAVLHSAAAERGNIVRSAGEERDAIIRYAREERDDLIRNAQAEIAEAHRRLREAEIANAHAAERLACIEGELQQARAEAQRARESEAQARRDEAAMRDMVRDLQGEVARLVERAEARR